MRVAFVVGVVALGRVAHADTDCAHVLDRLDDEVAEAAAHPIKLASPATDPDGEPCMDSASEDGEPTVETGKLSGDRATVSSDGPHGSGRYWSIDVRVVNGGHQIGACMQTSTTWWRNLPDASRKSLGVWHALEGGTLLLWSTLAIGDSEWGSLALPLVYRASKHQLVLDRKRTTAAVAQFGRMYRHAAAVPDDDARAMHVSAAEAYAAFSSQGACKR